MSDAVSPLAPDSFPQLPPLAGVALGTFAGGLRYQGRDDLFVAELAEGTSVALFELVTEFLRPIFAAHWEQVRPGVSVDEASEWVLRAILSLLTVRGPRNRSRDGLHTFLQRFLLPAIVR